MLMVSVAFSVARKTPVSRPLQVSAWCLLPALWLWTVVVLADTPLGWINSANPAAYTTNAGELEISIGGLAVNDAIDVLNYRDDLIAASGRLEGDSGNLSGARLELNYGITSDLSVFYRRQQQALTLDLGEISSVNLIDIDKSLDTLAESAGFKWTFFRGNLLNADNRVSAASLELSAQRSESNDFDIVLNEIRLDNLTVFFRDPQTFSVTNLEDEGWKAKLIYSWPFDADGIGTIWAGYGESESRSGTQSDLVNVTLARLFQQDFFLDETYTYFGVSLNYQVTPRLPLLLSYEFINVMDSRFKRVPENPNTQLLAFFASSAEPSESSNHTLQARISYWLLPELNIALTGNLYSNQFIGVLPHFSNPLSGSFASAPYGFIGLELGYRF